MEAKGREKETMLAISTGMLVLYFIFDKPWMVVVAAVAGGIGLLFPMLAHVITKGWLKLAQALGWFNGRVLLSLVFFVVLTPIALLRRMGKSDSLVLRPRREGSLWTVRDHTYVPEDLKDPW
ncbi:MAG: hypothetical protein KDB88_11435 [Flavobacteriales bacterium]|nr:hypothetical protein [Flavobacteriales bacterium]